MPFDLRTSIGQNIVHSFGDKKPFAADIPKYKI
jgi:hypothetical protein